MILVYLSLIIWNRTVILIGGYRRHNETFFLEEKRSLFYKHESISKFIQKYILSILLYASNVWLVLELAKLQKTRKHAKTSAQVGFELEILYR